MKRQRWTEPRHSAGTNALRTVCEAVGTFGLARRKDWAWPRGAHYGVTTTSRNGACPDVSYVPGV